MPGNPHDTATPATSPTGAVSGLDDTVLVSDGSMRVVADDALDSLDAGLDSLEQGFKQLLDASRPEPQVPIQPGRVVAGTYELLAQLGSGGMGQVFRARHLRTDGELALKVIRSSMMASPRALQRFELEARHMAALRHPHVVTVIDYGCDEGLSYLAM